MVGYKSIVQQGWHTARYASVRDWGSADWREMCRYPRGTTAWDEFIQGMKRFMDGKPPEDIPMSRRMMRKLKRDRFSRP